MKLVIGTRGSRLALAQTEAVRGRLAAADPDGDYSLKIIKTAGDRRRDLALEAFGQNGVFVRELERALLDGTIDLAVHSMKDMPAGIPDGLCFAKPWKREDPRDVLVLREASSLEGLSEHAVIGTGSRRRALQLLSLRPDLRIVGIRGNVDTRLKKLYEEKLDGIVLAAAGLHRLGKADVITQYLSPEQMIPAAAQGTLALELCAERADLLEMLNRFSDSRTALATEAERLFLDGTGADCHMPVGAMAQIADDGDIRLLAVYGDTDRIRRCEVFGQTPREAASRALSALRIV